MPTSADPIVPSYDPDGGAGPSGLKQQVSTPPLFWPGVEHFPATAWLRHSTAPPAPSSLHRRAVGIELDATLIASVP